MYALALEGRKHNRMLCRNIVKRNRLLALWETSRRTDT